MLEKKKVLGEGKVKKCRRRRSGRVGREENGKGRIESGWGREKGKGERDGGE